jgi:peptidoglycan/LPS O-acetylase OafA/YrhL
MSGPPARVDVLDGFRAYAILGVVSLHLLIVAGALEPGTTKSVVAWTLLGNSIDAFFLISGFVLFLRVVSRGGETLPLRDFALGRAARLFPPYWMTLAVMLLLLASVADPKPMVGVASATGLPGIGDLALNFSTFQTPARMFDSSTAASFGINGPLWMVSVILCFYIVFPAIARPYYRHPLVGLAIALGISLGWRLLVIHEPGLFASLDVRGEARPIAQLVAIDQFPAWAFSFGLGMTGAWSYVRLSRVDAGAIRRAVPWVLGLSIVAYLTCAYLYGQAASVTSGPPGSSLAREDPILPLAYTLSRGTLMAAVALSPYWIKFPFANRGIRRMADQSYGIYLIHYVVALYVGATLLSLPTDGSARAVALWLGVVVPLSAVYAYLMRRFIEQPTRAWARGYSDGRERLAPESAEAVAASTP